MNHTILVGWLFLWYDVFEIRVQCFISYLSGKHHRATIGDCFSSPLNMSCGVRQGSVLEPLLFYTLHFVKLLLVIV